MNQQKGHVTELWKPTFENVTREFITDTLYKILFSEKLPNFRFDFRENEAIDFIQQVLTNHLEKDNSEKAQKILKEIKSKCDGNEVMPVMIIKNYKDFFEVLGKLYESYIKLFFLGSDMSFFPRWAKENFFEQIWLRATADDFNNPEKFLRKQLQMANDNTFAKYQDETCLGAINIFDNNVLCVRNGITKIWDENFREFIITVYDKNYYDNKELFFRPHYSLPVIRYGIYEKDGKRICHIGSIQNKNDTYYENSIEKKINRKKYKVNDGIDNEDTYKVEPKNLLALSIFIKFLHQEGITEIEIPSMYVLDYEYHEKRNIQMLKDFQKDWTEEKIKKWPELYEKEHYYFERTYNKQDVISEIKTERLLLTFRRLLCHYKNAQINSYPGELDSFMYLTVPIIRNTREIKGDIFREMYELNKGIDR